MITVCVRCDKKFEQFDHPMAHFFSICQECREHSPETISDQAKYNFRCIANQYKALWEK